MNMAAAKWAFADSHNANVDIGCCRVLLRTHGAARANACVEELGPWILDGASACARDNHRSVVFLIKQHVGLNASWFCFIRPELNHSVATAVVVSRPERLRRTYTVTHETEQWKALCAVHREFMGLVQCAFPGPDIPDGALLRVKVSPSDKWFLIYPLGIFAKHSLAGFENIACCQWIVSEKSITEVRDRQVRVESELADSVTFMRGAYLILNTYSAHRGLPDERELSYAHHLLTDVLRLLNNVRVRDGVLSLRWTLNPSVDQLRQILLDPMTRYLFADFESDSRTWEVGDREHACSVPCQHSSRAEESRRVELEQYRGRLAHVRLARVFHCHSLFDPYRVSAEPGDTSSIGALLLATGAYFVEGSMTREPLVDFYRTIIELLMSRADVCGFLQAMSMAGACDFDALIQRAQRVLA